MKKNVLKNLMAAPSGVMAMGLMACGSAADTANTDTSTGSTAENGRRAMPRLWQEMRRFTGFQDVTG